MQPTRWALSFFSTPVFMEVMTPASRAPSEPSTGTVDHERDEDVVFPPDDLDQLLDLAHFFEGHTEPGPLLGPDGEQIPLPVEVYRVLRQVVDVMRQGKATHTASSCAHAAGGRHQAPTRQPMAMLARSGRWVPDTRSLAACSPAT
jgi:hypothetical protein